MKKLLFTTIALLFIAIGMNANTINKYKDDQPFVFVESGIEFAVFQDGQFDFNVIRSNYRGTSVAINTGIIDFSFNTGHNYDTYVQYDDYNAVIQIENTPIFYDYYGRVTRIGNIHMEYNNHLNLISRIGNMQVNYNRFEECLTYGNINNYNINYNYVPRHRIYRRPLITRAIVYHTPYRRNFTPRRYDYRTYRRDFNNRRAQNVTRNYRRPGNTITRNNNRNVATNRNNRLNTNRSINRVTNNKRSNKNTTVRNTSKNNNNRSYVVKKQATNTRTAQNSGRVSNTKRNATKTTQRSTNNANTNRSNKQYATKSVKKYSTSKREMASNNTKNNRR